MSFGEAPSVKHSFVMTTLTIAYTINQNTNGITMRLNLFGMVDRGCCFLNRRYPDTIMKMTMPYLNSELAKIPEYHPRENKLVLMKFEETCIPIMPKMAKNLSQSIHNNLFEYM